MKFGERMAVIEAEIKYIKRMIYVLIAITAGINVPGLII